LSSCGRAWRENPNPWDLLGSLCLDQRRGERTGQRRKQEPAAVHAGTIGRAHAVVNARAGGVRFPACRGSRPRESPAQPPKHPAIALQL
jgi:hypothetical protein